MQFEPILFVFGISALCLGVYWLDYGDRYANEARQIRSRKIRPRSEPTAEEAAHEYASAAKWSRVAGGLMLIAGSILMLSGLRILGY